MKSWRTYPCWLRWLLILMFVSVPVIAWDAYITAWDAYIVRSLRQQAADLQP